MSLAIVLTAEAEADLDEAAQWYERRLRGLGVEFVSQVRTTLGSVGANPELYAEIHAGLRRASVKRFPYGVFYRPGDGQVEVVGIFHDRRDPSVWRTRA